MYPNNKTRQFLKCKDYLVSGEIFNLLYDDELDMLKTDPQPSYEKLGMYYESDEYISHTDSRKTIFDKIYQFIKSLNLSNKLKLIKRYVGADAKILDIGCGTGDFISYAVRKNFNAVGTEPNNKARNIGQSKNLKIYEDSRDFLPTQFDVITMWHVLEHISDLESFIAELHRLLSDKGVLVVAVPNFKSFDAKFYKEFWAAYDVPRHLWHFSKTSIKALFSKGNFHLVAVKPMLFDSFYISLLSEKHKTGRLKYVRAFFIGCYSNIKAFFTREHSSQIYILRKTG